MSISSYLEKMKQIQYNLLVFTDRDQNKEENYQNLIDQFNGFQVRKQQSEIKLIFQLIMQISNNHHRSSNFFQKLEKVLLYFTDSFNKYFTNSEIFDLFKNNKRILLFLFKKKIITIDDYIKNYFSETNDYKKYFEKELNNFVNQNSQKRVKKMRKKRQNKRHRDGDQDDLLFRFGRSETNNQQSSQNDILFKFRQNIEISDYDEYEYEYDYVTKEEDEDQDFEEQRKLGENDSFICSLIRKDAVQDFVNYLVNHSITFNSKVNHSIFETNSLLLKREATFIEYATFFGSVQIFKFLVSQGVPLTSSLWLYGIHGYSEEIIQTLERMQVKPDDESFEECYNEAIKCHHNDIANYLLKKFLKSENNTCCFQYYNFLLIQANMLEVCVSDLIKYDYYTFIKLLLQARKIDINQKIKVFDYEYHQMGSMNKYYQITYENTLLAASISSWNLKLIKLFLYDSNIDVNQKSIEKIRWYSLCNGSYKYTGEEWLNENTNLQIAIKKGNSDVISFLLCNEDLDINENFVEKNNTYNRKTIKTILHEAVLTKKVNLVKYLLSNPKIDVNSKYMIIEGESTKIIEKTALNLAIDLNNIEILRLLLSHKKINVNFLATDSSLKMTPLCYAIDDQNITVIKVLLNHSKINVNAKMEDNSIENIAIKKPPLILAIEKQNENIIKLLLSVKNINTNATFVKISKKLKIEKTALYIAVENRYIDIIKLLLSSNSIMDVNTKSTDFLPGSLITTEKTPLYLAVENEWKDIVHLLISNSNIDCNTKSVVILPDKSIKSNATPLFKAVINKSYKIVQLLLQNKNIDVNIKSFVSERSGQSNNVLESEKTALYAAVENDQARMVRILLSHPNIDVNVKSSKSLITNDVDGNYAKIKAPLHVAVLTGNTDIIKMLLENRNIDINIKDESGKTPAELSKNERINLVINDAIHRKNLNY